MHRISAGAPRRTVPAAPSDSDAWGTPWPLFNRLNEQHRFTADVCADHYNHKLPHYFTVEEDGLAQSWAGERVWINPPYSNIHPWVEKAWREVDAEIIVMLIPATKTEQPWWQDLAEPYRDRGGRLRTENIKGRVRFVRPGTTEVGGSPPFGCVLLIWIRSPWIIEAPLPSCSLTHCAAPS